MKTTDLLDSAKNSAGLSSDAALAERLGVTKQAVSKWRNGQAYPDAITCEKLANLCSIPLVRVIGWVGEQRAISAAEKRVWHRLAAAAMVMLMLSPTLVRATENPTNGSDQSRHYAKWWTGLRELAYRLLGSFAPSINKDVRHGDLLPLSA